MKCYLAVIFRRNCYFARVEGVTRRDVLKTSGASVRGFIQSDLQVFAEKDCLKNDTKAAVIIPKWFKIEDSFLL